MRIKRFLKKKRYLNEREHLFKKRCLGNETDNRQQAARVRNQ